MFPLSSLSALAALAAQAPLSLSQLGWVWLLVRVQKKLYSNHLWRLFEKYNHCINLNSDYTKNLIVFYHACSIVSCFSVPGVCCSVCAQFDRRLLTLLPGLVRSHNIRDVNNGNGITNTIVRSYNSITGSNISFLMTMIN